MTERWKEADELRVHVKELNFRAERLERGGERPPLRRFLVGYFVALFGTLGLSFLGYRIFGFNPYAAGITLVGVIYLLAAAQRPRIVYQVLRSVGWFAFVGDPRRLRIIMLVIGIALLLFGLFGPVARIYPRH